MSAKATIQLVAKWILYPFNARVVMVMLDLWGLGVIGYWLSCRERVKVPCRYNMNID